MDHRIQLKNTAPSATIVRWILLGFVLTAGYFLVLEHRAHLGGAWYYLPCGLLLACPLMHLFMHHGHHEYDAHRPSADQPRERS